MHAVRNHNRVFRHKQKHTHSLTVRKTYTTTFISSAGDPSVHSSFPLFGINASLPLNQESKLPYVHRYVPTPLNRRAEEVQYQFTFPPILFRSHCFSRRDATNSVLNWTAHLIQLKPKRWAIFEHCCGDGGCCNNRTTASYHHTILTTLWLIAQLMINSNNKDRHATALTARCPC